MKILITGGAGYVGTTLIPLLLKKGHEITVYDKLMFPGDFLIPYFNNKNFYFIKGDVRDKELLKKAMEDQEIIIHLAAIVGFPACRENPDLAQSVNVGGSENVAALAHKDQFIFFASTGSNYGDLIGDLCTEETPLKPLSIYGRTKTEAEKIMLSLPNCTAYRFATAYGLSPRMRLDLLINEFTYQAVKQKYLVIYQSHFMRTFIHVRDIAKSILFAIDNRGKMKGQIYNAGGDEFNFSKKQICEILQKKTGTYVHYADVGEDADKRNYEVSYKKIHDLGYIPEISIDDGIDEMVRAFDAIKLKEFHLNY